MDTRKNDKATDSYEKDVEDQVTSTSDEATAGELHGGYAASGNTDTSSAGSSGDPTDEENLKEATTGAASAPNYGVLNTEK